MLDRTGVPGGDRARGSGTAGRVEVDLRETSFMDSAGLAVLVDAYRRLDEVDEMLLVRDPQPAVRRVLAVSGVDALIDVRYSEAPGAEHDAEGAGSIGR